MDHGLDRVMAFDRFALDLVRGFASVDRRDIELRPKAFKVLRHLAENAGRLVSKRELQEAVWGNLAVSDDSLIQCIRELRLKLCDHDHSLIKTVSRRGYLLDARSIAWDGEGDRTGVDGAESKPPPPRNDRKASALPRWAKPDRRSLMNGLLVLALIALTLTSPLASWVERRVVELASILAPHAPNLISEEDLRRISAVAREKQLPLPAFRIWAPAPDVPDDVTKFLGVWVSDTGWINSHRQFMMIITNVLKDGTVGGYLVNGPAKPHSHMPGPAFAGGFTGDISNGILRYDGNAGMHLASLSPDGRIEFRLMFRDGGTGVVMLDPAWTLSRPAVAIVPSQ